LLDPVEEALDPVAVTIEVRAEADQIVAIAFWRDVGPSAFLHGWSIRHVTVPSEAEFDPFAT
jgi:hypothetical protein